MGAFRKHWRMYDIFNFFLHWLCRFVNSLLWLRYLLHLCVETYESFDCWQKASFQPNPTCWIMICSLPFAAQESCFWWHFILFSKCLCHFITAIRETMLFVMMYNKIFCFCSTVNFLSFAKFAFISCAYCYNWLHRVWMIDAHFVISCLMQ